MYVERRAITEVQQAMKEYRVTGRDRPAHARPSLARRCDDLATIVSSFFEGEATGFRLPERPAQDTTTWPRRISTRPCVIAGAC